MRPARCEFFFFDICSLRGGGGGVPLANARWGNYTFSAAFGGEWHVGRRLAEGGKRIAGEIAKSNFLFSSALYLSCLSNRTKQEDMGTSQVHVRPKQ
jgi:hypothetical protein